jgi:hypothetical protein
LFDNIYAQGIEMGSISLNGTGHNIFYDVGNHFDGVLQPATTIIDIDGNNNVCIGDMFERGDAYVSDYPRININNRQVIATTNGSKLELGTYVRESGMAATLVDNTGPTTLFTVDSTLVRAFSVNYTIIRGTAYRTGTLVVASSSADSTGDLSFADDYVENSTTGVSFTLSESGDQVSVSCTTTSTGEDGSITYSINHLA